MEKWPEGLGDMLEFLYIERRLLALIPYITWINNEYFS